MRSCRSSAARTRETAAPICGSRNGLLSELSRGRRKPSTSSAQRNPFRESSRAMHSDPQISLHAIAVPFNSSRDGKIQRLCRVNLADDFSPVDSPSTRLCTDQFIREKFSDKTPPISWIFRQSHSRMLEEDRASAIPLSFERSRHLNNTLLPIKAMRRRIALRKHFVRNLSRRYIYCFRDRLGSAYASSRRFYF